MTNAVDSLDSASSFCNEQKLLNSVLKITLQPSNVEEKIADIVRFLCNQRELELQQKGAVFFLEGDPPFLKMYASVGFPEKSNCKSQAMKCHCGKAAISGKSLFIKTPQRAGAPHYCIPILIEQKAIGVLVIYTIDNHEKSATHIQFFETVTNVIASIADMHYMEEQLYDIMRDLKLSLVALEEEKKFSYSIIHGIDHGLLVVDNEGYILRTNRAAKTILEPFTDSLENKFLEEIFDKEIEQRLLTPTNENTFQQDRMLKLTPDKGQDIHLTFSNVAHKDTKGDSVARIISLSDISELFSIQKEMEKMNRLSTVAEIASAVAHEVRNPLAGIKIMAQSIEEGVVPGSEQHECSHRIIRQVDRLNELLTEFFSYARPSTPNKQPITLLDVIEETNHLIQNKLVKNKIELNLDIAQNLPKIMADQNQMQQVLLNLFLNSIDAIQQSGTISITAMNITTKALKTFRRQQPHMVYTTDDIIVTFSDDGAGMNKDALEKSFEPFYTTKNSGTGLGLSIVYRTLKENDADIFVESKVRKGTKFTLLFKKGNQ